LNDSESPQPGTDRSAQATPEQPDHVMAGVFAPILGLQPAVVPVEIDEGWTIDRMTDAEVREVGTWGIVGMSMLKPQYTVRFQRQLVARESLDSSEAVSEIARIQDEGYRAIELTVWALRLFKRGAISVPIMIGGPPFREDIHGASHLEQPQSAIVVYDLSADETRDFASFVREYGDGLTAKALDYPIRRFSEAETKQNPEDKIVDLMIACESLLLPDREGELSYRMALRFAFTLGDSGKRRRELFDQMKAAYAIRSWIVHGKTRSVPKLPNGQDADLVGLIVFSRSLGDLVREALLGAVISAHEGKWPPDWDAAILDSGATDSPRI
jgi:hypothetical protein